MLHESGHNWGLQHNFIASEAYTAAQVRSKSFTERYGLANFSDGVHTHERLAERHVGRPVLSDGARAVRLLRDQVWLRSIPGATTPEQERPTLLRWASAWSNPWRRFAMDEDVDWASGHAIDPRVDQFDLTSDNLGWCQAQLRIVDTILRNMPRRYLEIEQSHDPLRQAFEGVLFPYLRLHASRLALHRRRAALARAYRRPQRDGSARSDPAEVNRNAPLLSRHAPLFAGGVEPLARSSSAVGLLRVGDGSTPAACGPTIRRFATTSPSLRSSKLAAANATIDLQSGAAPAPRRSTLEV